VGSVGWEREGKGYKVVVGDLEGSCNEVSGRTASSKDEVERIACLVSRGGRWEGEVKRGEEWKEGGREEWVKGRRGEVKVAQNCERWAVLRKGAYQGIKLIDELSEGTWRAINDKDVKLERAGNCDSMEFKGGNRQMGKGRKRERPLGRDEDPGATTPLTRSSRGVREHVGGRGESSRSSSVICGDPCFRQCQEVKGLEGGIGWDELCLVGRRSAVPEATGDLELHVGRACWDHQIRVAAATRCGAFVWSVQRGENRDRQTHSWQATEKATLMQGDWNDKWTTRLECSES
jgi:hypothetical protein